MSRRDALLLRIAAGWTVFVWVVFLKNLLFNNTKDTFGFKAVHTVIAAVSILSAGVVWGVAARNRRRGHDRVSQVS